MRIGEILGFAAGAVIAPLAAVVSVLRRGRAVHRSGVVYRAEVTADALSGAEKEAGLRLAGPALVRFSSGLWRAETERRPDLLGVAIRFRKDMTVSALPAQGDQDLLFATLRRAWLFLPAAFTTNVKSFLWDDYYTVSKLDSEELGLVKFRLVTPRIPDNGQSREQALEQAVKDGTAVLALQARDVRRGAVYEPVARIRLIERVDVDEDALRFSPFRAGRGIVARGFLNAVRVLPYAASQLARPQHR